ncbi:unnamed protein product [Rodentolepis nana]|uniref:Uncharacterized protein n=1 Tax=Rodentolepis nana TaxID=102285 RepID=A0A3P7V5R6_RODNA|nr:unnamed protein product [Rodentolepis nana]
MDEMHQKASEKVDQFQLTLNPCGHIGETVYNTEKHSFVLWTRNRYRSETKFGRFRTSIHEEGHNLMVH